MATYPHDCPHCGTKRSGFAIIHDHDASGDIGQYSRFLLLVCTDPTCRWPAVAVTHRAKQASSSPEHEVRFWPAVEAPNCPEHVPVHIQRYFLQGAGNMPGSPDAAGAMFRKSLDVSLTAKFPGVKGKLFDRIEELVEQGALTSDMGDWAHHIRIEGNDAVHDEDPFTEDEAKALHKFTESVLTYLFTLPGMIAAAREETEGDGDDLVEVSTTVEEAPSG